MQTFSQFFLFLTSDRPSRARFNYRLNSEAAL